MSSAAAVGKEALRGKCEHCYPGSLHGEQCGEPASFRYPAMGGGWCRLCTKHGISHVDYAEYWWQRKWRRAGGL